MFTDAKFVLMLALLPAAACMTGAGEVVTFPTYVQGEAHFPSVVEVSPVFYGNYGVVASGDTLYHMELRHGRIHGKTPTGGVVSLMVSTRSGVYAVHDTTMIGIDGFEISSECVLPGSAEALSACGNNPIVLLDDGSVVLYSGSDLSVIGSFVPSKPEPACMQGFPGTLVVGYTDGTMVSFSVPSFTEIASERVNGSLLFLSDAGDSNLLFSTDLWNEVAVCSPSDLVIQLMFTFPETPVSAVSDSALTCIYAVCPSTGIQVCLDNGEIAWKTGDFGKTPLVDISEDCEHALVAYGNSVTLLLK